MKSYTLKIRGGVEVDSGGKKAGKGALIQEEKSATLGVSQDQILFQAIESPPQDSRYNIGEINQPLSANMAHDALNGGGVLMVKKSIGFMRGLGGVQTMNEKMPTLQAANGMSGNNKPCVCSAGFKPNQGAKAKGVGYEKEKCPTLLAGQEPAVCISFEPGIASRDGGHVYEGVSGTLRATPGDNQMTVAFTTEMTPKVDTKGKAFSLRERDYKDPQAIVLENHPNDSRVRIDDSGTIQTLTQRMGTGGGNVPMVMFENHSQDSRYKGPLKVAQPVTATYGMGGNNQPLVICLQGNGIDRADTAGCNGKGWKEDVSYTLNTIDRHAVAFGVTTKGNGDAFISEERHTALTNGGGQAGQGYPCVIEVVYPEQTGTIMANSHPGSYCGQDAYNDMFVVENRGGYEVISLETFHCTTDDKAQPIKARDYKDPLVICYEKTKK